MHTKSTSRNRWLCRSPGRRWPRVVNARRPRFRKLALQHHPDLNPAQGAAEAFARVCEAYDVLVDKQRRAVYDQYGLPGLQEGVPGSACRDPDRGARPRRSPAQVLPHLDCSDCVGVVRVGALGTGR